MGKEDHGGAGGIEGQGGHPAQNAGNPSTGNASGTPGVTVYPPGSASGAGEEKGIHGLALVGGIPSPGAVCTCGKKPGERGRHKKECPLSVSSGAAAAPNPLKGETSQKKGTGKDRETAVGITTAILSGGFGIMASRLGQHWMLKDSEAKQLAEPTVALLERYDLLAKLAMNSEWLALFAALGIVFTPKVMMTMQIAQMKKAAAPAQPKQTQEGGQSNVRNFQSIPGGKPAGAVPPAPAHAGGSGQIQREPADDGADNVKGFLTESGFGFG